MFSNFLFFLIALIIYTTSGLFEDTVNFDSGVWLSGLLINIAFVITARAFFRRLEKRVDRLSFSQLDQAVNRTINRLSVLALILFALDIYGLRLQLYLKGFYVFETFPTLGALLFLSLFLFYLTVIWEASFRVQRILFSGRVSKKEYIVSNISFSMPALLPWFCLSLLADVLGLVKWAPLKNFLDTPLGEFVYVGVFVIAIAVFGPILIKRLWHCKPLEDGEAKARLKTICAKTGLKYADILTWELFGGHMITAGVMGLVGRFRYILVTPALLTSLDDEQIEAVMLHEIGHVQKHHMLFYLFFFAGFIIASFLFFEPLGLLLYILPVYGLFTAVGVNQATAHAVLSSLMLISLFVLYFRFVFGFYMRNFERQADLHIYRYKDDATPLITTFYAIASYSKQAMEKPSWHHFSIGERVNFLERCQAFPQLISLHHSRVKKIIAGYLLVVLCLCAAGYTINYGWAKEPFYNYVNEKFLFQQMDLHPEDSDLYALVGDYYFSRNEYQKAIDAYENVLRVYPNNVRALNNLSMLFSTAEDQRFRDGARAVQLAVQALEDTNESYVWDTYAEALSANNDLENAVQAAKKALELAKEKKDFYRTQLERFESLLNQKTQSDANG